MSENKTQTRAEALAKILKLAGYKVDSVNENGVKFDVVRMKKGVDMAAVQQAIKDAYPDTMIHGQNVRLPKEVSTEQSAKPADKKAAKPAKKVAAKKVAAKKAVPKKAVAKKVVAKKAAPKKAAQNPDGKVKPADKKAVKPIEKASVEKATNGRTRGKSAISKSDASELPTDLLVQLVLGVYDHDTKKALIMRLVREGLSVEEVKSWIREVFGGLTEDTDLSGMTSKQLKKIMKSVPTEYLLSEIRARTQPSTKE